MAAKTTEKDNIQDSIQVALDAADTAAGVTEEFHNLREQFEVVNIQAKRIYNSVMIIFMSSIVAGLVSLGAASLMYYKALGLVTVASLLVASAIAYLSFLLLGEWLGFTLTLAGIAGAIVAIGVTADSFIIYFERIRDEIREGRSLRTAVETGWARARRTILVADFVSIIAAVLLYFFAVGGVRGFAFTLGLTTLVDLIVVFVFTKPIVTILAKMNFFASGHPLSGLSAKSTGTLPVAGEA